MRQALAGLLWTKQFYHYIVPNGWRAVRKPDVLRQAHVRRDESIGVHLFNRRCHLDAG